MGIITANGHGYHISMPSEEKSISMTGKSLFFKRLNSNDRSIGYLCVRGARAHDQKSKRCFWPRYNNAPIHEQAQNQSFVLCESVSIRTLQIQNDGQRKKNLFTCKSFGFNANAFVFFFFFSVFFFRVWTNLWPNYVYLNVLCLYSNNNMCIWQYQSDKWCARLWVCFCVPLTKIFIVDCDVIDLSMQKPNKIRSQLILVNQSNIDEKTIQNRR